MNAKNLLNHVVSVLSQQEATDLANELRVLFRVGVVLCRWKNGEFHDYTNGIVHGDVRGVKVILDSDKNPWELTEGQKKLNVSGSHHRDVFVIKENEPNSKANVGAVNAPVGCLILRT